MNAELTITYKTFTFTIDINNGVSLAIPVKRKGQPNAFYLSNPKFTIVEAGSFVGNVAKGGSCNCEDIVFNPHGNGTHTECAGHISKESIYITSLIKKQFMLVKLITIPVHPYNEIITLSDLLPRIDDELDLEAVVIRTFDNDSSKKQNNYSGANATYFEKEAIEFLNQKNIKHLLTDLPSLDSEYDTNLTAHKTFFKDGDSWHLDKSITELVYAPDEIKDGLYVLDLQISLFEADAAPSNPILYPITKISRI